MSYSRKPNYHFKSDTDIGLDKVPTGRNILVEDFAGTAKSFIKENNTGLTSSTTIVAAFAANNITENKGNTGATGTAGTYKWSYRS